MRDGVWPVLPAKKAAARSRFGPGLPLHVFGGDGLAEADIVFGDEDIHGRDLLDCCDRCGSFLVGTARKIGGNAACTNGNGQNGYSGGVHTLLLIHDAADASAAEASLVSIGQSKVKEQIAIAPTGFRSKMPISRNG